MNSPAPNALGRALRGFFADYLPRVRGTSPHTLHSYRDSLLLLLRFVGARRNRSVIALDIEDLGPAEILEFLRHLETDRHNCTGTRNVRLAAIHAFVRYCATAHPERLEQYQRVLAVPFKRTASRTVEYLDYEEIQAVLATVNRAKPDGRRDYTLLVTMFNTGARVQEIVAIRPCDLQLDTRPQVRLFGKGRKERICPLWPQTAELLRALLMDRSIQLPSQAPVFLNHRRERLTRFGVRYILQKYFALAQVGTPTLAAKRLHPHCMRHSTAVHLLRSGVDIVTVSQWLGHASVTVTNRYATVDIEMKRNAIEKAQPIDRTRSELAAWRVDASILDWLEAL
jgi:integrase/recombinase XerD